MPDWLSKLGPIIIGVAFLVIVVIIVFVLFRETSTFDEFSQYWGLFGTIVGVVTGAIPSFFFKAQADTAKQQADTAADDAKKEATKVELLTRVTDPERMAALEAQHSELF